jgi:hypothetical protein
MIIIHSSLGKSKKRKPNAKQRELAAEWDKLMKKYEPKKPLKQASSSYSAPKPFVRETKHYPSLNSGFHDCTKKAAPVYTGDKIKGIGTMHKSNAVPIFSDEQAIEIATMRRG